MVTLGSLACTFTPLLKKTESYLDTLTKLFNLSALNINEAEFQLVYDELGLQLFKKDEPKLGAIRVDFATGAVAHRRKFGGGKGQAIAKAVGV